MYIICAYTSTSGIETIENLRDAKIPGGIGDGHAGNYDRTSEVQLADPDGKIKK